MPSSIPYILPSQYNCGYKFSKTLLWVNSAMLDINKDKNQPTKQEIKKSFLFLAVRSELHSFSRKWFPKTQFWITACLPNKWLYWEKTLAELGHLVCSAIVSFWAMPWLKYNLILWLSCLNSSYSLNLKPLCDSQIITCSLKNVFYIT